jgi:hypothetical protein
MTDAADVTSRIIDHWRATIPATPLQPEPFDHLYFDAMLPPEVYADLLRSLPDKSVYEPINPDRWVNAQGVSTRDRLPLTEAGISRMPEALRPFWTAVSEALRSDALKRLVFTRLAADLAVRLKIDAADAPDRPMYVGASLTRDIEDYRIKPHPDGWPRCVTMQLYLPADESQLDLGTSLYVETPLWRRALGRRYAEVKRFPFRPNSAYCFAVNDLPGKRSLHGRERIGPNSGVRNTILVSWYAEPPGVQKASTPEVAPTIARLAA